MPPGPQARASGRDSGAAALGQSPADRANGPEHAKAALSGGLDGRGGASGQQRFTRLVTMSPLGFSLRVTIVRQVSMVPVTTSSSSR